MKKKKKKKRWTRGKKGAVVDSLSRAERHLVRDNREISELERCVEFEQNVEHVSRNFLHETSCAGRTNT